MTRNHRIVQAQTGRYYLAEVVFCDQGRPIRWHHVEPMYASGQSYGQLKDKLEAFEDALLKPVLSVITDFPRTER